MLELKQASFKAGQRLIVNQQSLCVPCGEMLALLGPNGAGKSTIMGLLSGRLTPCRGDVLLNDCPLETYSPVSLARCRAVMSQKVYLSFGFSSREVVALGRSAFAHDSQSDAIIEQALAAACASHLADQDFTSLSGGEQQCVQFARALAQIWDAKPNSAWLLLDEPEAGLGVAVVLHNVNLAAQYADKIALVQNGAVARYGTPKQVLKTDYLQQIYNIPLRQVGTESDGMVFAPVVSH
jgi:iron complex transport system ATP-binding protein